MSRFKKYLYAISLLISCSLEAGDFIRVHNNSSEYACVEKVFHSILDPLYGDQTKSLKKIADEKDRICELLYENGQPQGILVYKTDLVQEYALLGIQDAFEIKTLFVIEAAKNSGKGIGSTLLERILAAARNTSAKNVVVTVSESKPESLQFFLKKGFTVIHTSHGKYTPGVDEYLLLKSMAG